MFCSSRVSKAVRCLRATPLLLVPGLLPGCQIDLGPVFECPPDKLYLTTWTDEWEYGPGGGGAPQLHIMVAGETARAEADCSCGGVVTPCQPSFTSSDSQVVAVRPIGTYAVELVALQSGEVTLTARFEQLRESDRIEVVPEPLPIDELRIEAIQPFVWCPACVVYSSGSKPLARVDVPVGDAISFEAHAYRSGRRVRLPMEFSSSNQSVAYFNEFCGHPSLDPNCNVAGKWISGVSPGAATVAVTARNLDGSIGVVVLEGADPWILDTLTVGWDLYGVWGTSPTNVIVVGAGGRILHYDGINWTQMPSGTRQGIRGVWGSSARDVYAVTLEGGILHFDGNAWDLVESTDRALFGVWGASATDVFAVGASRRVLHYDGISWSQHQVPPGPGALFDIWGSTPTDVFAVGMNAMIWHYDGTAWSLADVERGFSWYGVWGSGASNVYAVGGETISHYGGDWWTKDLGLDGVLPHYCWDLRAVWGASETDVFAVACQSILHYDGSGWMAATFGDRRDDVLQAVWGSSATDVFAVGRFGSVLHYDGTRWTSSQVP
jgi:hypothetical protein